MSATGYGNLETWTGPPNQSGQHYTLTYSYDDDVHTYVKTITDALGYTSTATYDPAQGELLTTVDEGGNVSARNYDAFGRLIAVRAPTDPEGTPPTATMEYHLRDRWRWLSPAYAVTHNKLPAPGSHSLDTAVFVDGMLRPVQTQKVAEVRGQKGFAVSGPTTYDMMGRVHSQSQPSFVADSTLTVQVSPRDVVDTNPTTFVYDPLGRTTEVDAPGDETTKYAFDIVSLAGASGPVRKTTVTDANKHSSASYQDALGRQVATEEVTKDGSALTHYAYDAVGDLTTITDAAGNVTSAAYDMLGRRLTLDNPDTGLVSTNYDKAGNLIRGSMRISPRRARRSPISTTTTASRPRRAPAKASSPTRTTPPASPFKRGA